MTTEYDWDEWITRMKEKTFTVADELEELLEEHEDGDHDGGVCTAERANVVAFIAHRLGCRGVEAILYLLDRMLEYEEAHQENMKGNGG